MKNFDLKQASVPALRLVDSSFEFDTAADSKANSEQAEEKLLETLRERSSVDAETQSLLQVSIQTETDQDRLWFLLAALELAPNKTVATENMFDALCRLSDSSSPMLRLSAYRWLASIYRKDLRFENRAKLKLRDCMAQETGLMQQRVKYLLRTC